MTNKLILTITALTAVLIISCTKSATLDTTAPAITITDPTDGQMLMQMTGTDSATVSVHITDVDLHSYGIMISSIDGSDTLLYVPETHQEVNDLTVTQKFPLRVVVDTVAYKVLVKAEDHSGNESEATRNFSVKHM